MCHSRLAEGEAPACVQACPTQAISIVTVTTHVNGGPAQIDTSHFLGVAPDPMYTQLSTRYPTECMTPRNDSAADAATLRPQPPHWPLVIMLTLVPSALGFLTAAPFLAESDFTSDAASNQTSSTIVGAALIMRIGVALGVLGLAASGFHLGKPLRAWRIFLGWRKSWLSREALLLGTWAALAAISFAIPALAPIATLTGMIGLACSVMVYVDPRRHFWRLSQTAPRFFGTALVIGLAALSSKLAALALLVKLAWETRTFYDGSISARLQRGPLRTALSVRDLLGLAAFVLLVVAPGWPAFAILFAGELAERYLFFRAV